MAMKRLALVVLLAACGNRRFDIGVNAGPGGADVGRMAASEVRMSGAAKDKRVDVKIAAMRATAQSAATPQMLAASLDTIIGDDHTAVVISRFLDQELMKVAQKMQKERIPFLATTPTPPGLVSGNGPGFALVPGYAKEAAFMVGEAKADDKVAIIYIDDFYGNTLRDELTKALQARGIKVADERKYEQSWDEPRMFALGVDLENVTHPTLVYFLGRAPSLELVWQKLIETGGKARVVGSDLVESPELYENPEARFTGLRYVRFFDTKSQAPRMKDLHDRYGMWIGRGEMTGEAVYVYDAMMMVGEALRSGARTHEELIKYFASLGKSRPPFNGVGGLISFGADGEVQRKFQMAEVHDREIVVVNDTTGSRE